MPSFQRQILQRGGVGAVSQITPPSSVYRTALLQLHYCRQREDGIDMAGVPVAVKRIRLLVCSNGSVDRVLRRPCRVVAVLVAALHVEIIKPDLKRQVLNVAAGVLQLEPVNVVQLVELSVCSRRVGLYYDHQG